jgi:cyclophilin family peptidyl-prolyl cis-trans isomerase/predicted DsbA family dithiol-disulfide isomerase
MHKYRFLQAVLAISTAILLAACGGGSTTASPTTAAATPAPQGKLPHKHQVSAADLPMGQGTDICDKFPKPELKPFDSSTLGPNAVQPFEHMLGAEHPYVSYIAYLDLADKTSADVLTSLLSTVNEMKDKTRLVIRYVVSGESSSLAAQSAESVYDQKGSEAYWKMLGLLAENQPKWTGTPTADLPATLAGYAETAGADADTVKSDLQAGKYKDAVTVSGSRAEAIGVTATPFLFANDLKLDKPPSDTKTLKLIANIVMLHAQYGTAPEMVIDPSKDYSAWIVTEKGTVAVDLFADLTPETVNNFAYLACVGFYDGVTFHRVLPGFVAQAGDPTGTGVGGPGYTISDEYQNSALTFDREGWLSMAHTSEPNSAGSQFFITFGPAPNLDGSFTIFGQVVKGMDVVKAISPRDPDQPTEPPPGDSIETIVVRQEP